MTTSQLITQAEHLAAADGRILSSLAADVEPSYSASLVLDGSMFSPSWRRLPGGSHLWRLLEEAEEWSLDAQEAYEEALDKASEGLGLYWEEGCLWASPADDFTFTTEAEAIGYLTADGAEGHLRCFSILGETSADCAPVAWALAELYAEASGDPITTDALDGAMSEVVNRADSVCALFLRDGTDEQAEEWGLLEEDAGAVRDHYLMAALFTDSIEEDAGQLVPELAGMPADTSLQSAGFTLSDFSAEAEKKATADVRSFLLGARHLLGDAGLRSAQLGHDLWLTRNGHGAGFWDRGLGDLGEQLSERARQLGETSAYIGDDGAVHLR